MGHKFAELAFSANVKAEQAARGSRRAYEHFEQGEDHHDVFGPHEAAFIGMRDSFYMATVSETGWPYIQHRGGPAGFLKVLDEKTIGFADFRGNRQYISVGNLKSDDRVSLFLMDYANKARLKILGRARFAGSQTGDVTIAPGHTLTCSFRNARKAAENRPTRWANLQRSQALRNANRHAMEVGRDALKPH